MWNGETNINTLIQCMDKGMLFAALRETLNTVDELNAQLKMLKTSHEIIVKELKLLRNDKLLDIGKKDGIKRTGRDSKKAEEKTCDPNAGCRSESERIRERTEHGEKGDRKDTQTA